MTLTEVTRALRQLRVSGMAATLEPRIVQAQADHRAPLDLVASLVQDELQRRQDRLLDRRVKRAGFRDAGKTLDTFDFVLKHGLNLMLIGLVIGAVATAAVARALGAVIAGAERLEPATLALVATSLVAIATVATWAPARRATLVDPAIALRED